MLIADECECEAEIYLISQKYVIYSSQYPYTKKIKQSQKIQDTHNRRLAQGKIKIFLQKYQKISKFTIWKKGMCQNSKNFYYVSSSRNV